MKYIKNISVMLGGMALFVSCQNPNYPDTQASAEPSTAIRYAKVLFINASPDAPSLVYQVNNTQVASLGPQIASPYVNVVASSEQLKVKNATYAVIAAGDTAALSGDLVVQSSLTGLSAYTLFVTDTVNRPYGHKTAYATNKGGLSLVGPLADNLAIAGSKAGVRFYHMAPGATSGTAGLYLSNGGVSMGGASAKAVYKAGTGPGFTAVTPGSYNLQVTANSITDLTVLATLPVVLAPGKAYTIYVTGKVVNAVVKVPYAVNVVQHN